MQQLCRLAPFILSTNDQQATTFNYLYDGNGNVIAVCDGNGMISTKLAYSPFGGMTSGADLPFGFSTKPVDASSLVYYGFRFYNSDVGRWMSRDPIEEKGIQLIANNYLNIVNPKSISYENERMLLKKYFLSMDIESIDIPIDSILLFMKERPFSQSSNKFEIYKANLFARITSGKKHEPLYAYCANSPLHRQDYLGLALCDDIWYNAVGQGGVQLCFSSPVCSGEGVDAPCEGPVNCPRKRCRDLGYSNIFGNRVCCSCRP